ncbi:hypothetical protein SNEBB_004717 [Seison nebaliae]|nr:hypothetical protein SNEBB_004717 [Seison nebaliae]
MKNISIHFFISAFIQLFLIFYSIWHDGKFRVKYTDVDYYVFMDAAKYVYEHKSPYERATYRYTPLIAQMLAPLYWFEKYSKTVPLILGKIMFCIFNQLACYLIYYHVGSTIILKEFMKKIILLSYLYNPLFIAISTRGNADSFVFFLLILILYQMYKSEEERSIRNAIILGLILAIAIHIRIFPIIFCFIGLMQFRSRRITYRTSWTSIILSVNRIQFVFSITIFLTLSSLTLFYYFLYGMEFLEHSYLYHLTRKDIRHNFSTYYMFFYAGNEMRKVFLHKVIDFMPLLIQVYLYIHISLTMYAKIAQALLTLTTVFVAFGKIYTSQYFVWIISFLPICLSTVHHTSYYRLFKALLLWILAQIFWLSMAYLLEFQGLSTHYGLMIASTLLLYANINLLQRTLKLSSYRRIHLKKNC